MNCSQEALHALNLITACQIHDNATLIKAMKHILFQKPKGEVTWQISGVNIDISFSRVSLGTDCQVKCKDLSRSDHWYNSTNCYV